MSDGERQGPLRVATVTQNALLFTTLLATACTAVAPAEEAAEGTPFDARIRAASTAPSFVERDGDRFVAVAGRIEVPEGIAANPVARADWFLDAYGDEVGVDSPMDDLAVDRVVEGADGGQLVVYQRVEDGVPVFGAEVRVGVSADGDIIALAASTPSGLDDVVTTPTISAEQAEATALSSLAGSELESSELVILDESLFVDGGGPSRLAYRLSTYQAAVPAALVVFVDAHENALLAFRYDDMHETRHRDGFDCEGDTNKKIQQLLASRVYDEEGPVVEAPSQDAQDAYVFTGMAYDYLESHFDHEGHDGDDADVEAYLDLGSDHSNAFYWNDALWFTDGMVTLDIVVHEYVHGVVSYTAGLVYRGESGALNESMADVFGWLVDHDDDTIGEGSTLGTLRSMSRPDAYDQPFHIDGQRTYAADDPPSKSNDYHGVHRDSGIPNYAAYLIVNGGTHRTTGISVEGIGEDRAGQIFYRALSQYLSPVSDFARARVALRMAAWEFAQDNTHEISFEQCSAVLNAYAAVGIGHPDGDLDCIDDVVDNCPLDFNPDQDGDVCAATEPEPEMPVEMVCADQGAPCSGSGSAFDDECCGDLICVVGACQPADLPREQAACDEGYCARGLSCRRVGSAEAEPTCCARDEDYCEVTQDCCGLQDCVSNRCVGRVSGEECMSGDCVGASYCDGGTCS